MNGQGFDIYEKYEEREYKEEDSSAKTAEEPSRVR